MVKKTQWIWYRTSLDVEFAFLYNCRQRDLADGTGISKGVIVEGKYGFVATEALVPKVTGKIVPFNPNRRCKWEGLELRCQAILTAPAGQPVPVKFNYIVAELPDLSAQQIVARLGVPLVRTSDGKTVVNLEIARFKKQDKNRWASLI